MEESRKRGRPKKSEGEKFETPHRKLGRMADEDWSLIEQAAKKAGKSLTSWMSEILIRAAKRQLNE